MLEHALKSLFRAALCLVALGAAHTAGAKVPPLQAAIGNPADVTISGSVRLRHETLTGQPRAGLNPTDEQLALRTTLAMVWHAAPKVRIGAEVYDSRAWLGKPGSAISANDVNALELVQGYLALDLAPAPGAKLVVQAGRFTLDLGSRRLAAANNYRNTTNAFTGLRSDWALRDGTAVTLFYTLPQVRLPNDLPAILSNRVQVDRESFDLRFWGGLVARPDVVAGAKLEGGYYRLQERDGPGRPTRDRNLHTLAARIIREPQAGAADFEVEGAGQFGTISETAAAGATRQRVGAWFIHADAGYTFPGPARLRLSVDYDRASGDRPGGANGRFDTLFGMRRADFSPSGVLAAIGRSNISSPGVRAEVAPGKRFDAYVSWRALWLAERRDAFATTGVRDASGQSGSFAGYQVDARLRHWIVPEVLRAEIDAFWLGKGRFLKAAPNAPQTGNTTYLSLGLTASL